MRKIRQAVGTVLAAGFLGLFAGDVLSHCDTMGGPVIPEARFALEAGDITPVLKWVKPDSEAEVKVAFDRAVAVRGKGPEAQELADLYFLETLIRLHRAGEGAPYTGLKDEPVEPMVAIADQALADESVDDMIHKMSGHMAAAIREKFHRAREAMKHKDESVEAGREFVEAYVTYMHYVEGVHAAIASAGDHQHAPAREGPAAEGADHVPHAH